MLAKPGSAREARDRDEIVYVVDDDAAVRNSMRRLISSVGLRTETYGSAPDFLDSYDPRSPGCVVADVRMPGMSGLELQETLSSEGYTIPVIIVTAFADVPLAVRAMKAGAVDLIEKPIEPQRLIELVQRALAGDRQRRERAAAHEDVARRVRRLTPREREVVEFVVGGKTSREIAHDLGLSPKTVHVHRANAMAKMEAGSVAVLTRLWVQGTASPESDGPPELSQ